MLRWHVRIKILQPCTGVMDGVSLSHLLPGVTYDVPISLGRWLISQRNAEEDVTPTVGVPVPLDETSAIFTGGVSVSPRKDRDDDRAPRRPRARKRSAKR